MADYMQYTYSSEGQMVGVLCGVWINSVDWVISLGYRKLVCRYRRRWVFYGSVRALSCLIISHIHFVRALYVCIAE